MAHELAKLALLVLLTRINLQLCRVSLLLECSSVLLQLTSKHLIICSDDDLLLTPQGTLVQAVARSVHSRTFC